MATPEPITFIHEFEGWYEAEARRWTNPDGSVGGVVAVTATVHADTVIPASCEVWPYADIKSDVRIGYGASIGEGVSIGNGVSIGAGADIGGDVSIGNGVRIGAGAPIENGASIGEGADVEKGDWFITGGPCGSRNAMWTAIYSAKRGLRWWVGCKHGITTEELIRLVDETHRGTTHYDDYLAAIAFVTSHPALKRAMAGS